MDARSTTLLIIGGKMYLRDWDAMYCYDVKAK